MTTDTTLNTAEFVKLKAYDALMAKLDEAVARKRICTLLGPMGCGKTWLLDYWRRLRPREANQPRANEVLYVRLRPDSQLAVPTTCQLYSKLWYVLQRLERPAHLSNRDNGADVAEVEIKMYNARQLQELFPRLIEKMNTRNIRAVIVDNAHYLDTTAIEWLLDARAYYDELHGPRAVRAIILAAHRDTPAGKALLNKIKNSEEAKAAWNGYDVAMQHLSLTDFFEAISWVVARNLKAEFASDLNKQRESFSMWETAGGVREQAEDKSFKETLGARWRAFQELIEALDLELGPWDGKHRRIITTEILERVKKRLQRDA